MKNIFKLLQVFSALSFIFLVVKVAHSFESGLWPGEGRPSFRSRVELNLHKEPNVNSPLVKGVRIAKGAKIEFGETRYRTVKSSRIKVVAPVTVKGRSYGPTDYLSHHDYYFKYSNREFSFKVGESFECLQYRAEGEYLMRINGDVVAFTPSEGFKIESEPITEWWVSVVDKNKKVLGWILVDKKSVEFIDRKF